MNHVAMTIINSRKEHWPSRGSYNCHLISSPVRYRLSFIFNKVISDDNIYKVTELILYVMQISTVDTRTATVDTVLTRFVPSRHALTSYLGSLLRQQPHRHRHRLHIPKSPFRWIIVTIFMGCTMTMITLIICLDKYMYCVV